jgi:branched-chain amino acid transport system permease protein
MNWGMNRWIWLGVGIFCIGVPFLFTSEYNLSVIIMACIWALLAVSLNLIVGYTGQISIAHGAFFGIGAYTSALLVLKLKFSFWLALPMAGIVSCLFGFVVGYPILRLKGAYFAIASMCFGLVIHVIITHWIGLTRGTMGLPGIPAPNPIPLPGLGPLTFDSMTSKYYLILAFLFLTTFLIRRIVASRLGRSFIAISQDEILAESIGVYLMRYKVMAFSIGAFFAGIGGSLYSIFFGFISPEVSSLDISFNSLVFVMVGGAGTMIGPILGAFFLTVLPEVLQVLKELRLVIFGIILVVTIIYLPRGFSPAIQSLWSKVVGSEEGSRHEST